MKTMHSAPPWYLEDIQRGYYGKGSKTVSMKKYHFKAAFKKRYKSIVPFKNGNSLWMTPKPQVYDVVDYIIDLKKNNVRTVVVLLQDSEEQGLIEKYKESGLRVIHYPIKDFRIPTNVDSFSRMLHVVRKRLTSHSVAIHCFGGNGRTGLVATSLVVQMGLEPQKAIDFIRKYRPEAIETVGQEKFIHDFYKFEKIIQDF